MADTPSTPQPEEVLQPEPLPSGLPDPEPLPVPVPDSTGGVLPEAAEGALPAPDPGEADVVPPAPPDPTRRTRISGAWVGIIIAAVVLTLLLVFILQNMRSVKVSYFNAVVTMPIGVAMLLATVGGVLFAGVVASLRIWQLRHRFNAPPSSGGRSRRSRAALKRRSHPMEA
jgi:uncharacterized integral membrane protein